MMNLSKEKKTKQTPQHSSRFNLMWLSILLVAVAVVAVAIYLWQAQRQPLFTMLDGDKNLLVLIRGDETGSYRVQYTGRRPTEIQSLQIMLAGKILHVDKKEVVLVRDGQELVLEPDGSLPAGERFQLQTGDTFTIRILFHGQSLGSNYLYGFRMVLDPGEQPRTYELVLNFDYAIMVE